MLSIHELSKRYGKENVLINFNLDIENREIISVVGGSGSGKTTLLRLISGLAIPDNGKIILNNTIVNDKDVFAQDRWLVHYYDQRVLVQAQYLIL